MITYELPPPKKKEDEDEKSECCALDDDSWRRRVDLPANADMTQTYRVGDRVIVVLEGRVGGVSSNEREDYESRSITIQVDKVSIDMTDNEERLAEIMNKSYKDRGGN